MRRCASCGGSVDGEYAQAQNDEMGLTEGTICRDCARSVETNPQMENLIEEIATGLSEDNAQEFQGFSKKKQVEFAIICIGKGIAEGGSLGFHETLRKYSVLLLLEEPA